MPHSIHRQFYEVIVSTKLDNQARAENLTLLDVGGCTFVDQIVFEALAKVSAPAQLLLVIVVFTK